MVSYTTPIQETSYLSVPGVARYRTIMRKMFIENESMHYQLYKEEIFKLVKDEDDFKDYTIDDLKLDLNQLVIWNNLVAIQDPGIVHTIAEYKNKQYRYSMSEIAVEIERLTIKLENLNIQSASLSTNYFLRIDEALKECESINKKSLQEVNEWWHMLIEDFQRLNQNYKDYLRNFYTTDTKTLLESVEFILHKERFTTYLTNFIKQMQLQSRKIRFRIESIDYLLQNGLIEKIVKCELDIPRIVTKSQDEESIRHETEKSWMSLKRWFTIVDGQRPEYEKLLEITNEIIRSTIENANMISNLNNYGVSRKDDYKHFIKMFNNCIDINDAHCLSAHVFGISKIEHFKLNDAIDRENIKMSAFEKQANIFELQSHSRTYRERRAKEGVIDRSFEKMSAKIKHEEDIKRKEAMINRYIKDNKLDISTINDVISTYFRVTLLTWISNANMSPDKIANTEFGKKFKLVEEDGTCTLYCEDGNITMTKKYILEFDYECN